MAFRTVGYTLDQVGATVVNELSIQPSGRLTLTEKQQLPKTDELPQKSTVNIGDYKKSFGTDKKAKIVVLIFLNFMEIYLEPL